MASPDLYIHGFGHPSSKPSVNAEFKGEEEKKKGYSHDKPVGKVGKKRSRAASKKKTSPITFLAVDPSNFRAMVHHLTSISSSSSSSSLYGDHGIASSSSTVCIFNPHPRRPLDEQHKRENIYSSSPLHMANPSVLGCTTQFINPLQYVHQSSLLMKEEHDSLTNGEFILDDLDHLQFMLLLGNTNEDPSSTSTSIATASSPSLHLSNNNNNFEPWWFSNHSSIFPSI